MAYEMRQSQPEDRSLGDLFSDLTRDTATLVRQEVTLAKTELTDKASKVGKDVAFLAMGGLVAYAGMVAIIFGLIFLINALGLSLWVSALLVGLVVAAVGGALVSKGLGELKKIDPVPRQTVESLKEDKEWAKEQTR